jgi:hypothetical protein
MRVLLDECMPRPLKRDLTGHTVSTVIEMGWGGIENGELLALIRGAGFEAFVTVDQNLPYQQTCAPWKWASSSSSPGPTSSRIFSPSFLPCGRFSNGYSPVS